MVSSPYLDALLGGRDSFLRSTVRLLVVGTISLALAVLFAVTIVTFTFEARTADHAAKAALTLQRDQMKMDDRIATDEARIAQLSDVLNAYQIPIPQAPESPSVASSRPVTLPTPRPTIKPTVPRTTTAPKKTTPTTRAQRSPASPSPSPSLGPPSPPNSPTPPTTSCLPSPVTLPLDVPCGLHSPHSIHP